jgi:hypothetical protein
MSESNTSEFGMGMDWGKTYKCSITQVDTGARVSVKGDTPEEVLKAYEEIRNGLMSKGYKIASEEGRFKKKEELPK